MIMAKKKRTHSIKSAFLVSAFTPIILFFIVIAIGIALAISYASTSQKALLIVLIIYSVIAILFLVIVSLFSVRYFVRVYRNGLIQTSLDNMEKLSRGNGSLDYYPGGEIEEISQINEYVDSTKELLSNATLISNVP